MIDALWNIISCLGLVVLALAIICTGIILVYGIISVIKQAREEFKK